MACRCCEAFAVQEQDPFYLAAFLILCWLGELLTRAAAHYAETTNPKARLSKPANPGAPLSNSMWII